MLKDLELITPPTVRPVELDELKLHLRVDDVDEDGLIDAALDAAIEHLDGYAGVLKRAMCAQVWTLHLDRFPRRPFHAGRHPIALPLPPLISVSGIIYVDMAGVTQTLAPDQYQVLAGRRAEIWPAYGVAWPVARCQPRAVSVTFAAGYGAAADVPQPLKVAIKMIAADLYATRESQVVAFSAANVIENPTVARLLRGLRVPKT